MFALIHPEYPNMYLSDLNVVEKTKTFSCDLNEIMKFPDMMEAYNMVDTMKELVEKMKWNRNVYFDWLLFLEELHPFEYDGFVDLGLPSGTRWKAISEDQDAAFTFDEALKEFGKKNLPGRKDIQELVDHCKSEWVEARKGRVFTGPNGNSVFFPAIGEPRAEEDASNGYYWSSSAAYKEYALCLNFNDEGVFVQGSERNLRCGVRLVQKP